MIIKKQFLKDKEKIIKWLDNHNIQNYKLLKDVNFGFIVDVDGDVYITAMELPHIPVKFNIVTGSFNIENNFLKSLEWHQ